MIYSALILLSALLGALLCKKIHREKKKDKPLICYVGADCETVVRGKFSSFMGVGLEIYGLMYYLFIFFAYLYFYVADFLYEPISVLIVVIISGFSFLLSLILTFIQAFIIKTWCSWCLISATLSTLIFVLGFIQIF